jgi:probable rRNA maturation factor
MREVICENEILNREKAHVVAESKPHIESSRRSGGDGVPEVFISDEQDDVPIDLERWRNIALGALAHEGVRGLCELTIYFVDELAITDLNREHMGKDGPTDVLAFPLDGVECIEIQGPGAISRGPARPHHDHDDMPLLLGDVFVCPLVAQFQAPTHAGSLDDEIALLVVHGILHVLGYDHDGEVDKAKMQEHERLILSQYHWSGPPPSHFQQEHTS